MFRNLMPAACTVHLALALLVGSGLTSATALAQNEHVESDARALMDEGAAHYDRQDWEAARLSFLKAWQLERHPDIASNLAEVEIKLGRYVEAAEHLKYVLAALPEGVSEERTVAEQQLAECRTRILSVRIKVSVAGARIHLDGRQLGSAPLADEVLVEPGAHIVEAFLPGFHPARSEINGAAGSVVHVDLRLALQVRNLVPPAAQSVAPASAESSVLTSRNAVVYGASGLALLAAGAGTFFLAQSRSSAADARELRRDARRAGDPNLVAQNAQCWPPEGLRPASCGPLADKVSDQYRQQSIAIAAFIGAGVFAAGAVLTHVLWTPPPHSAGTTSVRAWAAPAGAGIELRGSL